MAQSLKDFIANKGAKVPAATFPKLDLPKQPVRTTAEIGVSDVVKQVPKATGTVLRVVGKELMKPVGIVAKTAEAIGRGIIGEPEKLKELPKEVGKIVIGKEEYSFSELWKDYLPKHKTAAIVIGTVIDIAADPLNLVGGIATKGLALAEKGVAKIPLVQKGLKPVFSTKVGIKEVDALIDQYKSLGEFRKAEVIESARNIQKEVAKLGKDEIIKVSNYIEKGIKATPEINSLGEKLKSTYASWKGLEKELGVKGGEIAQYVPHIKAKVPLGESIKKAIFPSKQWSTRLGGAEKGRTIFKFVSREGDELIGKASNLGLRETKTGFIRGGKLYQAEQAGIGEIAEAFDKHFFEENPAIQMAYRGLAHAKAITSKEFFNSIKQFASKTGVETTAPELKGLKFIDDIARQIDNYYKSIQPEELKLVLRTFDAVQNWWKGQALVAPSYHIRNMVGNIWNNFLAGVKNPIAYIKAGMLQSGKAKGVSVAGKSGQEILELAQKRGVLGKGWYAADIPTAIEGGIEATWKQGINPLSQQNYGFRLNKAIGSAFENNARLAHFIDKLEKGTSIDDAVLSVKKFLFDYQDLTTFEKTVLKRIFPFYTWTRKNIPLQLENLIKQPGKYAGLEKVIRGIEDLSMGEAKPANEKYLSDYIKSNTAMRVKYNEKDKTYYYFLLGNWLPSYQAIDFLQEPLHNIMAMITPIIKTPIELIANKSSFFRNTLEEYQAIENYPGETTSYLGFNMPKKVATILRNIRILNELDKLNPGKIFGGEKGEPSIFQKLPAIGKITPAQYKYGKTVPAPTQAERLLGTVVGKLSAYKETGARERYQFETEKTVQSIKQAIKSAARKGDKKRVQVLNEQLREFIKKRGR